jgi:hypothetical protein
LKKWILNDPFSPFYPLHKVILKINCLKISAVPWLSY